MYVCIMLIFARVNSSFTSWDHAKNLRLYVNAIYSKAVKAHVGFRVATAVQLVEALCYKPMLAGVGIFH
jgi:hypothetical protein